MVSLGILVAYHDSNNCPCLPYMQKISTGCKCNFVRHCMNWWTWRWSGLKSISCVAVYQKANYQLLLIDKKPSHFMAHLGLICDTELDNSQVLTELYHSAIRISENLTIHSTSIYCVNFQMVIAILWACYN